MYQILIINTTLQGIIARSRDSETDVQMREKHKLLQNLSLAGFSN